MDAPFRALVLLKRLPIMLSGGSEAKTPAPVIEKNICIFQIFGILFYMPIIN